MLSVYCLNTSTSPLQNMSRLQSLKALIQQRLTVAVDEIIGHFERTITEYEEEMESRKLLNTVFKQEEKPQREDTQQSLLIKEEQQEWSSNQDQEESERPHIKEEKEDFWSAQEFNFQITHVPVKSEEDEEKPQSSQLDQRQLKQNREAEPPTSCSAAQTKTEANVDDRGASEPGGIVLSGFKCLPGYDDKTSHSSEAVTGHRGDDWMEIKRTQTDLITVTNKVPVNNMGCNTGNKSFSCSKCSKRFGQKHHLQTHMRCHTGEKPFSCSLCGKRFTQKGNLTQHLTVHTREKPCSCPVCGERFAQKGNLTQHMTVHTRERLGERLTAINWDSERTELHLGQNLQ
ncbi:zinc finger protein 570-like [Pempheris klunzingeri]|uniref:zinc finger protein 570-like n=1 Tax=Pempheris klunzingeri TaxID=3127111 RepID=UPI00397EDD65